MSETRERSSWDYKTVPLDPGRLSDRGETVGERLNELGDDGWELAGTAPMGGGPGSSSTTILIFKRPKQS